MSHVPTTAVGACRARSAVGIGLAHSGLIWDLGEEERATGPASHTVDWGWQGGVRPEALPKEPPTSGQRPWVWFVVMIMLVMMKREFSSCGEGGGERALPHHLRSPAVPQGESQTFSGQCLSRLPHGTEKTMGKTDLRVSRSLLRVCNLTENGLKLILVSLCSERRSS